MGDVECEIPEDGSIDGGDVTFSAKDLKLRSDRTLTFQTGAPGPGGRPGAFVFKFGNGEEAMRLDPDGQVFLNGSLLASQSRPEIWDAFKGWLFSASGDRDAKGLRVSSGGGERAKVREALCLLNSMILSGEKHSEFSRYSFRAAMDIIDAERTA